MTLHKISKKKSLKINIIPLIDIIFLMLVFFMLATNFTRNNEVSFSVSNQKQISNQQNKDQQNKEQQQKQKIWEQEKLGLMKTDIAKSILDREQRSKKESLTDRAIALIKGLSSISKLQGEKGACDLFEGQIKKIKELLAMGADRATVQSYLRNR